MIDQRDLEMIGRALDALEGLHDFQAVGDEKIRHCLCQEASAWRAARAVFVHWRQELGLPTLLRDRI